MDIYRASIKDIYWIATLWKKLSDYHKNFNDYLSPSHEWRQWIIETYSQDINRSDRLILIAKYKGKPIGYIRAEIRKALELFNNYVSGYISDLYVDEDFRGKGIAEELMNEAIKWFIGIGIYNIKLTVNSENTRAINFYKKLGFSEVNKTLKLEIR